MSLPGFGLSTRNIQVTLGGDNCVWHTYDHAKGKQVPIENNTLKCFINGIGHRETTYKEKPVHKLNVFVKAEGQRYTLETGIHTIASRCFLRALDSATHEQLKGPVTVKVSIGKEDENVIFVDLWDARGAEIRPKGDDNSIPPEEAVKEIFARVRGKFQKGAR